MTLSNPAQYISGRTVQEQMNSLIDYVDQRAADVALDAIASDVAQVHQDMLDADADATAAAASAAAAAGTLANAVKKTGEASQSIAGDIAVAGTLSGGVVTGTQVTVPTPTNNTDAATKKYVDDADALKLSITNVNNYAVGLTGNQTVAGIKEFSSRVNLSSLKANTLVDTASGTSNNGQWRVVGKITGVSGSDSVRVTFLALANQSTRLAIGHVFMRNNNPSISVWIHKSFPEASIALNYDGAGNAIILMQTQYAYQPPHFFPLYVQKNDVINPTAIDYTDTTVYATSSDFPYANTVYGSFIGVDV